MASSPIHSATDGRRRTPRRDERGVAFPSPVAMLSVVAVLAAAVTFVATRDEAPTEERIDTATIASSTPSDSPTTTPPTKKAKPKPQVKRGEVYVEVYNNSGITGLAATTSARVTEVGWAVVGEDNWYGNIPATTVYFPKRLEAEAKQLALDLGVKRTAPAVAPMKMDRLTLVLTGPLS
ncbi:MAG: LytR C-terminal domain-containing protein [Nocardioides sp.]|uniref:LytR C-terminal domain-containing protein n=1 Tax=Nocardioides sp. TaxID=35761 RepID=UPI003F06F9C2